MYAKQSTAKTFLVGPILDADGAAKTDEVVANIKVTKNGTVGAADASSTLTHDHAGMYKFAAVDGDDFDTLGESEFSLNSGTNAMASVKFQVVDANNYDSLVSGSDKLQVHTDEITAGLIVAATLGADCITNAKIADGAIAAEQFAADAITNAKIADNAFAVEQFKDACITAAKLAGDCITSAKIADDAIAAEHIAAAAIVNATFAADVGSTAYATNIIALSVRKVLDEINLNHLMKDAVASNADMTAEVPDGTVLSNVLTDSDTSQYAPGDDSLNKLQTSIGGGDATEAKQDIITAHLTDVKGAGWAAATDSLEEIRDKVDAIPTTAMRGTDGANTTEPDAAGTAAGLHSTTDALINGLTDVTAAEVVTALETNGSKLDHLWEMTEDDGGVRRLTENALEEAPSGTGASAATIADAVWDEAQADHEAAGSFGETATEIAAIPTTAMRGTNDASTHNAAAVWAVSTRTLTSFGTLIADIWNRLTSALTTNNSIGKLLVDNIDAKVSEAGGGSGLNAQETRDAMKLAPTAGDPAAGSVDKHLDDTSTHSAADVTGGTTVAAAVTALQGADGDTLKTLSEQVDLIAGASGPGADPVTLRTTEADTTPVADVNVWISMDEAGTNVIAGTKITNSAGEVTFSLDAGVTYWMWRQKDGMEFETVPESFIAVAD